VTIQNWILTEHGATVVCDSLVTAIETNRPICWMSKAWIIPHLPAIVAAKDWLMPALRLWARIAESTDVITLRDAVRVAPEAFALACAESPEVALNSPDAKAVVFGWDHLTCRVSGYQFRAINGYRAEELPVGRILMPHIDGPLAAGDDWFALALEQQRTDRALQLGDRDNIGGNLAVIEMRAQPEGLPTISIRNLGPLPHFDDDRAYLMGRVASYA
jgi:hypothetical protein